MGDDHISLASCLNSKPIGIRLILIKYGSEFRFTNESACSSWTCISELKYVCTLGLPLNLSVFLSFTSVCVCFSTFLSFVSFFAFLVACRFHRRPLHSYRNFNFQTFSPSIKENTCGEYVTKNILLRTINKRF